MKRATLGQQIKRARLRKGWTQDALARKADLGRVHLAQIESGHRAQPTVATRRKLAKALGVPITELLN